MFANLFYSFWLTGQWYGLLLFFSLVSLPLTQFLFGSLPDKGYPIAKVLGIGICAYLAFVFARFHLAPFSFTVSLIIVMVYFFFNLYLKRKFPAACRPSKKIIFFYELFFVLALFTWTFIKGLEPSIRSLEKYMDFGFIQSLLNNKYLPPPDMWFASTVKQHFTINYYYFGHFVTAFLTKLSMIPASVTYNLMLCTIFALSMTISFSLGFNLYLLLSKTKNKLKYALSAGFLAAYFVNLAGNLHTIYLFSKGYNPETPVPFWKIFSWFNPGKYWYPNATRFIPFTIHEFPSYSYVVSDLHGHVLDIPFVLLILGLYLALLINKQKLVDWALMLMTALTLGINYMTNSTDFLVYSGLLFFVLVIKYAQIGEVVKKMLFILFLALLIAWPFSSAFKLFASQIGVNCAPAFLVKLKSFGPFLFESNKCQVSPIWMLFVLWGFFWLNALFYILLIFLNRKQQNHLSPNINYFIFFMFVYSILLTLFAEFFYFKDIYPAHFRANTMFKLGYQAFIMLSILSAVTLVYALKKISFSFLKIVYLVIFFIMAFLIIIYPLFSIPSYFGLVTLSNFKTLDGSAWIDETYPESGAIIRILNQKKLTEPNIRIVEAHGDSYTDYNVVSAHTGLPTIIGWPIHEWLWRGGYEVVGPRAEEVRLIYESPDLKKVREILQKYQIKYLVITSMEIKKYPGILTSSENESGKVQPRLLKLGKIIYHSGNNYLIKINDY